jgi:hypothetical protein
MTTLAERFVASAYPLPAAVQLDLAKDPVFSTHLCQNPELTSETWDRLWSQRRPSEEASGLVSRSLTAAQRAQVFKAERRVRVVEAMLEANQITPDEVPLLNLTKLTSRISERIFNDFGTSPEIMSLVGPHLSPAWHLAWLAGSSPDDVSDDAVAADLQTIDTWWGNDRSYRLRRDALTTLFIARPSLISRLAKHDSADCVKTVIAGSQELRSTLDQQNLLGTPVDASRYVLLAYVSNPRAAQQVLDALAGHSDHDVTKAVSTRRARARSTITEDYEKVSDPATLEWLVRRASPFQGQEFSSRGRLGDLLVLSRNPEVTPQQAAQLAEGLREFYWDSPLTESIQKAASVLLKGHPDLSGKIGHMLEPRTAPIHAQPDFSAERHQNMDSFIEHSRPIDAVSGYAKYVAEPVTAILGDSVHQWRMFLELLTAHPGDGSIRTLAQTAKRLGA